MRRLALLASIFAFGCAQVIGLDDFRDEDPSSGGNGGDNPSSGGSGGSGGGGAEGGAGGDGGNGAGGSEGGSGGMGPTSGEVVWAYGAGGTGIEAMHDVAVSPTGEIYFVGSTSDDSMFTIGSTTVSGPAMWIGKLDAEGTVQWANSYPFTGGTFSLMYGVDADENGAVFGIYADGTLNIDGAPLDGVIVAKVDSDGSLAWSKSCGSATNYKARRGGDVALDASGNVVLASLTNGAINCATTGTGRSGIVISKLDPTGTQLWARGSSSGGYDRAAVLSIDAGGNIIVAGNTNGVNFGGADLSGAYAAKLAPNGAHVWSRNITSQFAADVNAVTTMPNAGIVIGGTIDGPVSFGGSTLTPNGSVDGFVLFLDPAGTHVVSDHYGNGRASVEALISGPGSNVTAAGYFEGSFPLGDQNPSPAGTRDGFLLRLTNQGAPVGVKPYGGPGDASITGLAIGAGLLVGAGNYTGAIDFGTPDLEAFGGFGDAMLLGIAP